VIEVNDVTRVYGHGATRVQALNGVSLSVPKGQFLSVMGSSGSGKSTMLNLLGALDLPTSGTISIDGRELSKLSDDDLSRFRRDRLGFVFQFFNLLPTMTAVENAMLPALLSGKKREEVQPKAQALLEQVGLKGRSHHRPDELSGGEMQRVAVARAILGEPALLLADEPTGNLDSKTGVEVLEMLEGLHRAGRTIVMITHDQAVARRAGRTVRLQDGRLREAS
jgi:putative ABC transport system ATP-binding protein